MRKLVITHHLAQPFIDQIKSVAKDWEVVHVKDQSIWEPHLKEAEIVAGWKKELAVECLEADSNLRWVQTWSAGVDSLPLEQLGKKEVILTSANGVHAFPISETILSLMLSLTRKIHAYVRNQVEKKWHHAHMKLEMHSKTVGIIGVGAIGKETARLSKAFGMKVLGLRRSGKTEEFVDKMYRPDGLNELLSQCDYVVVTAPLTKDTYQMIGTEQFKAMKETAFFINIGRGETTDEKALIQALQTDQIAGAGLDVFEKEPLSEGSPLWELENVIITPHTSGSTEYYDERVMDIFLPNLDAYIKEKDPHINRVDYIKGY
jgi:phosphoglycerate dehydrogenase-like enzyme